MASIHKASVLSIVGYLAWFAILVRLLYLATNDQSSGAESLGLHLGVGLSLLALLGIPYFIVRLRSKRRGEAVSWFLVMMWTTIIALLLAVGGFYGRLHTSAQPTQAAANKLPENQQLQPVAQRVLPDTIPKNEHECYERFVLGPSSVKNVELLRNFCQSAFDATKHPVARARDLCTLMAWSDLTKNPTDATTVCNLKNPAPACPADMEFDLNNMRCEVSCDGLHGYAPDASGKSCYLACPDGSWPIYVGTVKGCNR